jgi:hypothetical protein
MPGTRRFLDLRATAIFRVALAVSIATSILPVLVTRYLPLTDAPEHAAVMATLRHFTDPTFSGPYELELLRSQYLVFHLAGAAVTLVVGDAEVATRVLVAATGIAFPLAFRSLLRAVGRDERLALFGCLPFWSRPLVLGFLPFVASIPLALYALGLVYRAVRRGTRLRRWSGPTLAVVAVVLFYAHVSTWMVFVGSAVVVAVIGRRPSVAAWLAPSAGAAVVWWSLGNLTLGGGTLADPGEIHRMGMVRAVLAMPVWIFDVWRGHGDEIASVGWWTAFLTTVALSARSIARHSRRTTLLLYAPFVSVLAIYLLTPFRVGAAVMLNVRLAPVLVLLAFLPTRLPRRAIATLPLGLVLLANLVGGVTALAECRAARAELGDLDAVVAAIPPGARLLTITFDPRSRITHVFPWAHVGAYHRVRAGGVSGFSFSELHHWPIHYKPEEHPPVKPGAMWDFHPCSFRNAIDGPYYDYVLVRGTIDPFRDEPEGPVFRRVLERPPMTLYQKAPGTWAAAEQPDNGPCPPRKSERR